MAAPIKNNNRRGLYRGFSTYQFEATKSFKLRDVELVKMDLLNHIFTRRGERVMMPNFGTMIPEAIFEPLTSDLVTMVTEEIVKVVEYDPRVNLINIQSTPDFDNSSLTVAVELFYIELNLVDNFELNIEFEG